MRRVGVIGLRMGLTSRDWNEGVYVFVCVCVCVWVGVGVWQSLLWVAMRGCAVSFDAWSCTR